MEFKTKADYDKFLSGNELHIQNKVIKGKFELLACNSCLSHFDNKKELALHEDRNHSGWNIPSGNIEDSDFQNGGTVFETLICDLCDKEKTSVFKRVLGGFVFCSDCTKEKN